MSRKKSHSAPVSNEFSLILTVIEAKNLAPKDSNGLSDPYCVIRLSSAKGTKKTHVIKKTLNPLWNETFILTPLTDSSVLKITCWDADLFGSDFEGQVTIDLSTYTKSGINEIRTYKLQSRGKRKEVVRGELVLNLFVSVKDQFNDIPEHEKVTPNMKRMTSLKGLAPPIPQFKLFGDPLISVMERERSEGSTQNIPKFIARIIERLRNDGIKTEGLFRKPGSYEVVSELKHQVDRGLEVSIDDVTLHDLASLLKKYLNELPEPLLTYKLFEPLIVEDIPSDGEEHLEKLKHCILQIPKENQELLKEILKLTKELIRNCSYNKMDLSGTAICMSPSILWDRQREICINLVYLERLKVCFEMLVMQYDFIFKFVGETHATPQEGRGRSSTITGKEGSRLFLTYDTNGDGVMDKPEFTVFYHEILATLELGEASPEDIDSTFNVLDVNKDGNITQKAFTKWWKTTYGACSLRKKSRATLAGSRG